MARSSASRSAPRSQQPSERRDATLLIVGGADPGSLSGLCESARVILAEADTDLLVCDMTAIDRPDLGTVDALARLTLVARHLGGDILVLDPDPGLRDLLDLAGLADVVRCVSRSGVEPEG